MQGVSAPVPCGGHKPLRAVSQQRDRLSRAPVSCQPPGPRPQGSLLAGTSQPRCASTRGGGRPPGSPGVSAAPRPGRNSRPPASWARGASTLSCPPPKTALPGRSFPPQERYPTGRLLLFSLFIFEAGSLYFGACIWIFRTCLQPN